MRGSATSLPPPSPLSWPADSANDETEPHAAEDPLADVPELQTYMARSDEDKTDALKLVADSVAQMRQTANQSLIFHPLNSALAIGIISLIARYIYDSRRDIYLVGTTCAGLLMCTLAACRMFTQNYLYAAEGINWAWLGDADMIVTKFGDEIIGTVVIDWISGESRQKRKKAWRGEIKAWTVRMKYRRKGVGSALLEDAVKEAKKKGAESIEFADDHASKCLILLANGAGVLMSTQIPREYCRSCTTLDLTSVTGSRGSCSKTCWRRVQPKGRGDRPLDLDNGSIEHFRLILHHCCNQC